MNKITLKFLKAQNGDCFILSFNDDEGNPRNILIDGGREETYYDKTDNTFGELKDEIDLIRKRNEFVDLLILTHIDNDHICGLLTWFETDQKAYQLVKRVWFNSGKLIAECLKKPENSDLSVGMKIFHTSETGVHEAIEFEDYLLKHKIWDRRIILKGQTFEEFGVKIKTLSPDSPQLEKLLDEYKSITKDESYTKGKRKEKDWNTPLVEFIKEESESKPKYQFSQDSSVKNGSSITFILTILGKNFLFLGDSHPRGIVSSLKELNYTEAAPLPAVVFKLSHHGSKSNTNKELIKLIRTENYFLSSDSSGHHHPHKRTLARIIEHNPTAIFHFNYDFVKDNIFQEQDFKDFPNFKIKLTKQLDFENDPR